jgi:DNA-binding FadR family transcriptional regulator
VRAVRRGQSAGAQNAMRRHLEYVLERIREVEDAAR